MADFLFEKELWEKGFKIIAGVDEVGRGAFAGPVFAACVVFRENQEIEVLINDSKKLTAKQREIASIWIKKNSLAYGIGSASVKEIDKYGIVKATEIAFRKAIKKCEVKINYLLVDAFYVPYTKGIKKKNQKPIIKGDSKSLTIAAASIIAKVERDNLMTKLSSYKEYRNYNWDSNKGYGTKSHRDAIKSHGPTKHHRKLFLRKTPL